MTIGERIRAARKSAGMTQEQLAKAAGTAVGTIHQYESSKRQPRLEQLAHIAEVLNIDILELLDLTPQEREKFELERLDMEEVNRVFDALDESAAATERALAKLPGQAIERQILSIAHDELNQLGKGELLKQAVSLSKIKEYQKSLKAHKTFEEIDAEREDTPFTRLLRGEENK